MGNEVSSLIPQQPRLITISKERNPDSYYDSGIYVRQGFRNEIIAKAKSVKAGTIFKVNEDKLGEKKDDNQIEESLPKKHLFNESAVCAIVSELIESEQLDKECLYLLYTSSRIVGVDWYVVDRKWRVDAWLRVGNGWLAGLRVLSPAN